MSIFSKMPGVFTKLAELAGAGLASAAGAFLFAQITRPATPPPPQIVQIKPVQDDLVKAMRSENAALIEELRKAEIGKEAATQAAVPRVAVVASPKPQKSSQAASLGRQPKADHGGMGLDKSLGADKKNERVYEADTKAPMDERAQPAAAAPPLPASGPDPATAVADSTSAIDRRPAKASEFEWIARLKQIPDIFRAAPAVPSVAPRPPLPVGELDQGAM